MDVTAAGAASDSDDDITDLTGGMFADPTDLTPNPPSRKATAVQTAKGSVTYDAG